jgi:hypothetical protein
MYGDGSWPLSSLAIEKLPFIMEHKAGSHSGEYISSPVPDKE